MTTETKNYVVPQGEWKPLSDIMRDDYETTDTYCIHVNYLREGNVLGFTYRTGDAPTESDRGRELPAYCVVEITADTGDDVYLRGLVDPVNVEIYQKV